MKCPECGGDTVGLTCQKCNIDLKEYFFKLAEEEEKKGNNDKALEYLYELRKSTDSKEVLAEIEKKVRSIRFVKDDIVMNTTQDEGKKEVKKSFLSANIIIITAVVVISMIVYGITSFIANSEASKKGNGDRVLETVFLFHFNQTLNTHADFADKSSYNGLLKVLRKHKNMKFNIHISGTLIQDLLWYSPETLNLIKDGIADGQFELVGSTYAQNVMYSTDDESNKLQLQRHKEIIKEVFGVEPKGFWNPERTWRQTLAPIITNAGYEYLTIEDHITAQNSKLPEWVIRSTENGNLRIINDDYEFMNLFNSAVDLGDNEYSVEKRGANLTTKSPEMKAIFRYLRKIYDKDTEDRFTASYAEDAEATGNWDLWVQKAPEWDFENLDKIFTEMEKYEWIKTVHYGEAAQKDRVSENLAKIDDGAAMWMEKAAGDPMVSFGEGNYKNWKEYNDNSPKLKYYKEMQMKYIELLGKYKNVDNPAVKTVYSLAQEAMLTHQFEFGCTGIGGTKEEWDSGKRYGIWERMRTMSVYFDLMERILNKKEIIEEADVNNDNIKELVVVKGDNYFVFSTARGGRILYWFDMKSGAEIIGNELVTQLAEEYVDDNFPADIFNLGQDSRFLVADNSVVEYFKNKFYYCRTKGLNEIIKLKNDEVPANFYNMDTKYSVSGNTIEFVNGSYKKKVSLNDKGFDVEYIMPDTVEKIISYSEFNPDYYNIINGGRTVLAEKNENGTYSLVNTKSNIGIEARYPSQRLNTLKDSLFGRILEVEFLPGDKMSIVKKN